MGLRRYAGGVLAAVLLSSLGLVFGALAQNTIAPDDPKLIARMNQVCLSAALSSGGIDKKTKGFCQCVAPIFSRHMTPESRSRLLVENRTDVRPDYDNPDATLDEIMKACPPASP
jgi:hypothetical protein